MKYTHQKTIVKLITSAYMVLLSGVALAQSATADGEIRKVDIDASRVVIKHGEWTGMRMGAMTMAFKVRPASLLTGLKVADKVHFAVEVEGSDFVVTAIEPATRDAAVAASVQTPSGN